MARLGAPRLVLAALWALVLAAGVVYLARHPKPPHSPERATKPPAAACTSNEVKRTSAHAVARGRMVKNHRIRERDLRPPAESKGTLAPAELVGKYLECPLDAGDLMVLHEVRALPVTQASANKASFLLPLGDRGDLVQQLNAGSEIDVFDDVQPVLRKAPLLALQCDGTTSASCVAVLDLTASDGQLLSRIDRARLRIVVVGP